MKRLEFHREREEDYLRLDFDGAFDTQAALESELEPFLQALEEHANGWMPDVVEGKRRRKYSRAAAWKSLEEERDENSTGLGLYRTKWPALDMSLSLWFPPLPTKLGITIKVKPISSFTDAECCRQFVEMVRSWASRYPVTHAVAHSIADSALAGSPRFGRDQQTSIRDGFDKIYEVSWLNIFGPKLVETVGRERMLSTPAWRVEELPNGSVLLVTWPTAADFASEEARLAQARAHVHLRPDLDLPTVLRNLRERSATLAPVEPRFHPDVAPLLSRVVDRVASHERQRKIAEFNAYQPPEPEEWLPADAALPSDVEDPKRALEIYSYLAELLVALLHTKVPSVFEETPESLTDVDYQFWHEEFPRVFERKNIDEHAVPAIGAYLGQVLVRNLGGQWIPRKKFSEAQVRVGNRVWLPFVRAWRYMRSCQSLLDFSLTQLYRVAERHRS
ncbi:hypothetical protein [Vitiosangium sp. GDMCC 1.1324]|uniref:hypothetical protein n=1 Tax=Vitiosangium sp. (strain GDMCC 1.1324) TaxID=2138576 RepID=UPI000D3B2B16|nr:hypothetical protein [Vitiosangium sp. GDMCC 1.1324]PTL84450.1 hypothetical protein DAT35_04995 [Vitiosangium sp. GDMCC 1.1324]